MATTNLSTNSDIRFKSPLPEELFGDIARTKAQLIAEAGRKKENNNSRQLRKFYDELVMWNDKIQQAKLKAEKYQECAPFIKMLKAKVAYARGRKHVDESFEQFFMHIIQQIDSVDSLKYAKLFMEAFMGFYKAQEK